MTSVWQKRGMIPDRRVGTVDPGERGSVPSDRQQGAEFLESQRIVWARDFDAVLIGFLLGAQLLFGLIFGGTADWVADLAGFGAGFGMSFVVGPGGPSHLLRLIRQR